MTYKKRIESFQIILLLLLLIATHYVVYNFGYRNGGNNVFNKIQKDLKAQGITLSIEREGNK